MSRDDFLFGPLTEDLIGLGLRGRFPVPSPPPSILTSTPSCSSAAIGMSTACSSPTTPPGWRGSASAS